jgi:hypothetical protein
LEQENDESGANEEGSDSPADDESDGEKKSGSEQENDEEKSAEDKSDKESEQLLVDARVLLAEAITNQMMEEAAAPKPVQPIVIENEVEVPVEDSSANEKVQIY